MKHERRPNSYSRMDLDALYEACQRRAGELMAREGRLRTPEERATLALDTAHLLLSVAATLREDDVHSVSTIWAKSRLHILAAFLPKHERALRSARYRTFVAATDAAFAGRRQLWLGDAFIDNERACDLALSSEAGLLRVLNHLDDLSKHDKKR